MIEVYLVRHAIAEERDAARWPNDAERPLTAAGEARFRRAARGLATIVPEVDAVLASPYRRAWRTAEILARETAWPAPDRCEPLEADRSPLEAMQMLRERQERGSVALVGHEPHLSRLASLLLVGDADTLSLELRKGAVALLAFAAEPGPAGATLSWSVTPKILRALSP